MKKFLHAMFESAVLLNHKNIISLFEGNSIASFVDLGCDDGLLTLQWAKAIGTKNIYGVDLIESRMKQARKRGVVVRKFDLNKKFKFASNSLDVVHANQVIEHIQDSDSFLKEIYRVLKPGGYAVISTENASSWCNIVSSLFGWQIFSLTNFSGLNASIGNPFSIHRSDEMPIDTWHHVRIYNVYGLKEYFEIAGFHVEKILGSGYFPFPTVFGLFDTTHAHFITYKLRKSVIS
jgi:ubiquinone/menaquinone biosynthesis C-methylase UbiE